MKPPCDGMVEVIAVVIYYSTISRGHKARGKCFQKIYTVGLVMSPCMKPSMAAVYTAPPMT